MKKIHSILMLLLILPFVGVAQTGPGGVGTADGASSLVLWLDANTITGLNDGDDVSAWTDQSGYGNSAVTANDYTCEQAPEYEAAASGQNGHPSVYFDGDNLEVMEIPYDASLAPNANMTIFGVFQPAADGSGNSWGSLLMLEKNDTWKDGYCFGCRDDQNDDWFFYANDYQEGIQPTTWAGGNYNTNLNNGTHYVVGMTHEFATGDITYWQNDAASVAKIIITINYQSKHIG